jgi:acyl-CoA dehydrogenase
LLGDLELVLANIEAVEPLYEKICEAANERFSFTQLDEIGKKGLALGVINEQQAELFKEAELGRLRTINVDDFAPDELLASAKR